MVNSKDIPQSQPELKPEINPIEAQKLRQLFGHCFEISKLDSGDSIPVGGKSILNNKADIKTTGDFEAFNKFFSEAHELVGKYNLSELRKWLDSQNVEINEKVFASLFAFTKVFEKQYPNNPEKAEDRRKLYLHKGESIKLSDIFNANSAECAEIAALAQAYIQQEGISSSYFSGDVLWSRDYEFSDIHSFIIIRHDGKVYIFDPTNPVKTASGNFPSVYTLEADFDREMTKSQNRFVTARNILSKKVAYFGVSDGTNIEADQDIV